MRLQQRSGSQKNETKNDDNSVNQLHDSTVVELRDQLRRAASHIKQLANDKHVLIEVGNRLRAELLRNGSSLLQPLVINLPLFLPAIVSAV